MQNGFQILVWAIFLKCIFEFMINTAPQGSNSVNGREKYFNNINFDELSAQWSHGPVVRGHTLSLDEVGLQLGSSPGVSTSIFFSFIVFLPFGFSLLTPLASRDFCENVFLVLCTKIGSFHHIDASFFIVCPLIDHNIASWHCQSVVDPRARALGEWIY